MTDIQTAIKVVVADLQRLANGKNPDNESTKTLRRAVAVLNACAEQLKETR